MYDFMTKRPVTKLDYEQDIYIKPLLSCEVEELSKMEQPKKAWHYIAKSLVDKDGKSSGLNAEFIGEQFTNDWVQSLYADILDLNAPKKKVSLLTKKKSGTT
jgi:predicted RecB family nuclease